MHAALPTGERGPVSGTGIGLRDPHFEQLMQHDHGLPWIELLTDNFLARSHRVARQLDRIAERFPLTLHCVGMNLGGTDPLNQDYLQRIKAIQQQTGAAWVSDHLCFTAHAGRHYHDLLPLPYSDEALRHIAQRINHVQDLLGEALLIENVSAYVRASAPMSEAEFLAALCDECDCLLLCDVNNLYVNQVNLGMDAQQAIDTLPLQRIREIHLGGFDDKGSHLLDAHNNAVSEPVWQLYESLIARLPDVPSCIEWDNDIPELAVLLDQAGRAENIRLLAGKAA